MGGMQTLEFSGKPDTGWLKKCDQGPIRGDTPVRPKRSALKTNGQNANGLSVRLSGWGPGRHAAAWDEPPGGAPVPRLWFPDLDPDRERHRLVRDGGAGRPFLVQGRRS